VIIACRLKALGARKFRRQRRRMALARSLRAKGEVGKAMEIEAVTLDIETDVAALDNDEPLPVGLLSSTDGNVE
jgi:hypothetical protein